MSSPSLPIGGCIFRRNNVGRDVSRDLSRDAQHDCNKLTGMQWEAECRKDVVASMSVVGKRLFHCYSSNRGVVKSIKQKTVSLLYSELSPNWPNFNFHLIGRI